MWLLSYYHNTVQLTACDAIGHQSRYSWCTVSQPHPTDMLAWFSRLWKDLALHVMKCLFLEHRVTFAIIHVKFNNHKRVISYALWKGHGSMKISPRKKIPFLISSEWKDAHISNSPRSKRTLTHMCGAKSTSLGSCVCELFKSFQLYTCLKCTQSTLLNTDYQTLAPRFTLRSLWG